MAKVKHHGFAQLILIVLLFLLAVFVFGGWTEGPLTSALFLGFKAYGLYRTATSGQVLDTAPAFANDLLTMIVAFIINLVIFYVLSAILIFVWNLFFSRGK